MLNTAHSGDAIVSLVDVAGRTISEKKVTLQSGLQSVDLSLENTKTGLYQVVVRQGNDLQVSRLVVE
jgi:hypothetical protein